MAFYYAQIRPSDWCESQPGSSWREVEQPGDDVQRKLVLIESRLAQVIASALATVEGGRSLEERFREQADKWERETRHVSSPTQKIMHPSYQAILGMGREVVPLLLRDLLQNRREWFWALSYITQANPINREDAGKMDKMIAAWVKWGKERGLL